MKTLTLLTTISILFSSVGYCEKVDSIDFEKEFNHLIDGMYEVESWFDGNKTHFPPFVSGRWVFYKGKIMSIIHNRIDSDNIKSSIRWGYGFFKDNTLVNQAYIKDAKQSVSDYVKSVDAGLSVTGFKRLALV